MAQVTMEDVFADGGGIAAASTSDEVAAGTSGADPTVARDEVQLLLEAIDATRHASRLWIKLLKPYFSWVFRRSYHGITTSFEYTKRKFLELDEETQKSILLSLAVLVGLGAIKRLIQRSKVFPILQRKCESCKARARLAWLKVKNRVGQTSKLLADLLPHLLLVAAFGLYLSFMPSSARSTLESPALYFVLAKAYPVIWSTDACIRGSKDVSKCLSLWISFYLIEVVEEIPLLVPFLSRLMKYVAYDFLMASRLFLALWIAIPFTDGAARICSSLSLAAPIRRRKKSKNGEFVGWLLESAGRYGLATIPTGVTQFASDLANNWVHLLTLPFMFTPGFLTYYGAIVSGKVIPIRSSLRVGNESSDILKWTRYWIVFSVVDGASGLLGWVPLYQHCKLAACWWLSFPYFEGAKTLFCSLDEDRMLHFCSYFHTSAMIPRLKKKGSTKQEKVKKDEKEEKDKKDEKDEKEKKED